jgi:hypothetical protein
VSETTVITFIVVISEDPYKGLRSQRPFRPHSSVFAQQLVSLLIDPLADMSFARAIIVFRRAAWPQIIVQPPKS